jgi:hypothetical protein
LTYFLTKFNLNYIFRINHAAILARY